MATIYTTIYTTISNFDRDDCEHLAKTYTTKGAFGSVYEACKNSTKDCNYVLKIIIFDKEIYEMSGGIPDKDLVSIKKTWTNEVKILQKLNSCQELIGELLFPKFYDAWYCSKLDKTTFFIVMEKFEGDIDHFLSKWSIKTKKEDEMAKTLLISNLKNLSLKLRLIHNECNICMNDINLRNIFYKQIGDYNYEFVFGDTGLSTDKMTKECQEIDWLRLNNSIENLQRKL
jgi:serine/threonine protein kinase